MSLSSGDLTTPALVTTWLPSPPSLPSPIISQLITSMTGLILQELNRPALFSNMHMRTFDGLGNMQIVLPDYPVTSIVSVQVGQALVPPSILPASSSVQPQGSNPGYGYRFVPWGGNLPGENAVVEFAGGFFPLGAQNIKISYVAGYLIPDAPWQVSATDPYQVQVDQGRGIWCRDNGVTYADGTPLVAVLPPITPTTGQYIAPPDGTPGLYTFSVGDASANLLISYSFVPAVLSEACNQMVAERMAYRSRVGEISKSLGGQESIRYMRGGSRPWNKSSSLPPEVMDLIWSYVNVVPPAIGAPV